MHSLHSDDGEYTPIELVNMCKEAGIRIMSITDHTLSERMQKQEHKPNNKT